MILDAADMRHIHMIRRLLTPKVISHPFVLCTAADGQSGYPIQKFAVVGELMAQYAF